MTANRTQGTAEDWRLILELKIDEAGKVTRKATRITRKDTLDDKLIGRLYPGIRVARVSVPNELSAYEESLVEERMKNLVYDGVRYKLAGASGSAKDGKFYFVDEPHAKPIAERYQFWPEAAITYFSILISDCKLVTEELNLSIAVVKDHVLGTNDCRGWIRKSIYRKLRLKPTWFSQFRLAFDAREPKQAKGGFKTMSDRAADKLGVDIILPESSCKPALKGGVRFLPQLRTSGHLYTGPAILGIKQWSRESEFEASSTLVEHASEEALELEIMVRGLENVRTMRRACEEGDYRDLLKLLGKSETPSFDTGFDPEALEGNAGPPPTTWDPVEAVLLADKSGSAIKFPYVLNWLNRNLARWGWRTCTSAGFKLPSFALVDDGILIEYEGKVLSASDWVPKNAAITSLTAEKSLCIRYPIRMQEDLLPVRHLTDGELVPMFKQALGRADLPDPLIAYILGRQLRMEGSYILHSQTAALNGGDFDFDTICTMPCDLFPRFFAGRVAYGQRYDQDQKKNKTQKAKALWWNLERVAMKARGNKIGSITDLKTSCLAAGRLDKAYDLVGELQNALDALKWKVQVNEQVVSDIRKEVEPAPWLQYKRVRKVSDLPKHLEIADTDKVGRLYNYLRQELGDLFLDTREIGDFRGLFSGEAVTGEMFAECQLVNSIYGDVTHQIIEDEERLTKELKDAQAHWNAMRKSEDREARTAAWKARNKAQEALWDYEEETKERFHYLHLFLHYWAQAKQDNRRGWAQALNHVVSNGIGTGAVLFHAFPQEVVDAFAEQTGGESVPVRLPKLVDGHVRFDDQQRAFLVERIVNPEGPDGEKWIFLFQYKGNRTLLFENTSVPQLQERS